MQNNFSLSYNGLPAEVIERLDELKFDYSIGLLTFTEWVYQSLKLIQDYEFMTSDNWKKIDS